MSINQFQSHLAGVIAAQVGIAPTQASLIAKHVIELPSHQVRKTFKLQDIGEVVLINQKIAHAIRHFEKPYEAIVTFNVGTKPRELRLRHLAKAKEGLFEKYKLVKIDKVFMGGLEGEPDLEEEEEEILPPEKGAEPLQGDPDSGPPMRETFLDGDPDLGEDDDPKEEQGRSLS